ncbi:MAG: hypothetical protein KJ646_00425 [Nanoarchaeota archaeon]|nr:hypothetical protein [Nanoarchaeota archaeon]MBU4116727.1 hypothetical protein [Nanoarchaeota archaeon]
MLDDRIMYFGLIKSASNIKSLMDRLPDNFTSVNMLLVSPTVGHNNSADIKSYEKEERLTQKNVKLPEGAKMVTRTSNGEIESFFYAEGYYRIL